MGRDIYVEYKHLNYHGSKSSDLLMAFDRYFSKFPKYSTSADEYFDDDGYYCLKLSRREMSQVMGFVEGDISLNSKLYENADELFTQINNIYMRMSPNDLVEVWTS